MPTLSMTLALLACSNSFFGRGEDPNVTPIDTGWEADADADADADTDTDTDADTDLDPDQTDDDGDGLTEEEGDCDDTDPEVGPDAEEVPYDGIDNDCDEETPDDDLDGDGYLSDEDCDDEDELVSPEGTEIYGDEKDNDCDGETDERFETEVADTCDCGAPSAMDVDSSGKAHIAYANADDGHVWYTNISPGGTWGATKDIAPWSLSGEWLDLAVDGADRVQVAYTWQGSGFRQVEFVWRDSTGSWSSYYVVDDQYTSGSYNIGAFVSLDTDSNNLPSIAYYDDDGAYGWFGTGNGVPVIADYTSLGVDYSVYTMLDEHILGDSGYYTDVVVNSQDYPMVAFTDFGADEVQFVSPMQGTISETIYGDPGYDISIAKKTDDTPCVAFQSANSADLMYGCRLGSENWDIDTVDSSGSVGAGASLAFDSYDNPWIAYYNESSGNLKVATNDGTGWQTWIVDGHDRNAGAYPSLAIARDDTVHISYYDVTYGRLMYARSTD